MCRWRSANRFGGGKREVVISDCTLLNEVWGKIIRVEGREKWRERFEERKKFTKQLSWNIRLI